MGRTKKISAKIREAARQLNPIDDPMFKKMAESKPFCQEILRVLLEDPKLVVESNEPQWAGTNLQGRSVILDAKCTLGNGTETNIEVQKSDEDDHQRRVRYNGAILTTNITDPGTHFKDVPDVCVVYITRSDFFHGNHALYHVDRALRETGEMVYNGFTEVYANATAKDGSDTAELLAIFTESNAYSEKFPETSARKRQFKETEGGTDEMGSIVQDLCDEAMSVGEKRGEQRGEKRGEKRGERKGRKAGRAEMVKNALARGNTIEQTAAFLGLSVEEVKKLSKM